MSNAAKPPKSKLTMAHVQDAVRDVRWLTPHDVGILLARAAPLEPHEVYRAAPAPRGAVDPLAYGYGRMAVPILEALTVLEMAESRVNPDDPDGGDDAVQYRMVVRNRKNAGKGARALHIATAEEASTPADTKTGVTQAAVYRHILDCPGITDLELVDRLGPMWKPNKDVAAVYRTKGGVGNNDMEREVPTAAETAEANAQGLDPRLWAMVRRRAARAALDPTTYMRLQALASYVAHSLQSGFVERKTEVRYYFVTGPAKPKPSPEAAAAGEEE